MNADRFQEITARYAELRIAVVGDYSCDRYLEIDPSKQETSIETGLPVYNVTNVRAQPGAAGTIASNLAALGIGEIWPVGYCGADGEGFELRHALKQLPGVKMDHFIESSEQRTFTYCKPLVMEADQPPRELNRLDSKNWHPTPSALQDQLANAVRNLASQVDAMIVLEDADLERAARAAVWGGFQNAGQTCISVERIFVEEGIAQQFLERVQLLAEQTTLSSETLDGDLGPVISPAQKEKILDMLGESEDSENLYIRPRVIFNPHDSSRIMTEEIFGPVISVHTVQNAGEAVDRTNALDFGLNASIFTQDLRKAREMANEIRVGKFS